MASRHPDVAQNFLRAQALLGSIATDEYPAPSAPTGAVLEPIQRDRELRTPTPARGIKLGAIQGIDPGAFPERGPATGPQTGASDGPDPNLAAVIHPVSPAQTGTPNWQVLGPVPAPPPQVETPTPAVVTIAEPKREVLRMPPHAENSTAVPRPSDPDVGRDTDDVMARLRLRASLVENAAATAPTGDRPRRRTMRGATQQGGPVAIRWRLPGRTVAAFGIVLVAVVALVAWRTMAAPAPAVEHLARQATGTSVSATAASGTVVVHVVGQVAKPGLVELPAGARVQDAITAAGGPLAQADLSAINLARAVTDGEQIVVPLPGQAAPAGGGGQPESDLVNVNTADAAALQKLPGVGPVLAERIVAYRTENGPFTSVEDLQDVPGIGPGILAKLKDQATV